MKRRGSAGKTVVSLMMLGFGSALFGAMVVGPNVGKRLAAGQREQSPAERIAAREMAGSEFGGTGVEPVEADAPVSEGAASDIGAPAAGVEPEEEASVRVRRADEPSGGDEGAPPPPVAGVEEPDGGQIAGLEPDAAAADLSSRVRNPAPEREARRPERPSSRRERPERADRDEEARPRRERPRDERRVVDRWMGRDRDRDADLEKRRSRTERAEVESEPRRERTPEPPVARRPERKRAERIASADAGTEARPGRRAAAEPSRSERQHLIGQGGKDGGPAETARGREETNVYLVRVGRFKTREDALRARDQISESTKSGGFVVAARNGFRVQVGAYRDRTRAEQVAEELRALQFDPVIAEGKLAKPGGQ